MLASDLQDRLVHVDVLALDDELDIGRGRVIESQFERVHNVRHRGDLGHHGNGSDGGSGEAGEDVVKPHETRGRRQDYALSVTLAPHVHRRVLRYGSRYVVVVRGGDVDDAADVLRHAGRNAGVGLVARPQLTVGVGAPAVELSLVRKRKGVRVPADDLDHATLQAGDPRGAQLVDIVTQAQLPVSVVPPPINFTRLECHHC